MNELVTKIKQAAYAYYHTSKPVISDLEFDRLVADLKSLDPNHYLFSTVNWGAGTGDHLNKFPHSFEVGSLPKMQSTELSISTFSEGVISSKLDGISGVAYYEDGNLVRVLTRGDGEVGLDITSNLSYCNIPKSVNPSIKWVRGEVVTTWEAAKKYEYTHPRNMAAGLANSNEFDEAHTELKFVAYDLGTEVELHPAEIMYVLASHGFETARFNTIDSIGDYLSCVNNYDYSDKDYNEYPYPVDGAVFRSTSGEQFAIKYPTQVVDVKVVQVIPQVSDRGRVIPIIEIEPVQLAGAMITYCSGFNYEAIKLAGIGPGAVIKLTRANEIIPHWVSTVTSVEPQVPTEIDGKMTKWHGVHLEVEIDRTRNAIYSIIDYNCVDGVGAARINEFINFFEITSLKQLVDISNSYESLNDNEEFKVHFGGIYYPKMIEIMSKIKSGIRMSILLESTYSRNMGGVSSEMIEDIYQSNPQSFLDSLDEDGSIEDRLMKVLPSYVVAEGIKENLKLITEMLTAGFNIIPAPPKIDMSKLIKITLTGKLSKPRGELLAEWSNKVIEVNINQADYLVTDNSDSQSSKAQAARKLGKTVISESEFRKLIGD